VGTPGSKRLGSPPVSLCVPVAPGLRVSFLLGWRRNSAEIQAKRHWDGTSKASAGVWFLPLWCWWVNWGFAEPVHAGSPRRTDSKMAHVRFSPCLTSSASCQHGGGCPRWEEGRHWLPCRGFYPVPAFGWEINDSNQLSPFPGAKGVGNEQDFVKS